MYTQLNPPNPVDVMDKGSSYAIAVIDYGQEHDLIGVTALDQSGEIWCAPNPKVRMQKTGRGDAYTLIGRNWRR